MLSVIIPSRNSSNLNACVEWVRKNEPDARIIVVWDGDALVAPPIPPSKMSNLFFYLGVQPFIFARNCNIGISMADTDDVVLLNDDALLRIPGGFTLMQTQANEHQEYGVIASGTNSAGYRDQRRHYRKAWFLMPTQTVAFLCVLIPRRTLDKIGLLDERFITYGGEDVDYCRRVRRAGLRVGVFDGCFVDHYVLPSSFQTSGKDNTAEGLRLLAEKWKDDPLP